MGRPDLPFLMRLSAGLFVCGLLLSPSMALDLDRSFAGPAQSADMDRLSPTGSQELFGPSNSWIQTVSCQCAADGCAESPCGCGETAGCNGCGYTSCCDDLCSRESLTNGFGGIGYDLAECGILTLAKYTHFYQGVTTGGANQTFRSGGKLDVIMLADTGKLGWWDGGQLQVHAVDYQVGENINADAVGLAPSNINLLTPVAREKYALTTLLLMQQITDDGWTATVGRYSLVDLWAAFFPDYGRGIDGFMNVSAINPLNIIPSVPVVSNTAGVMKMGAKGPECGLLVLESQNSPTTVGLEFPNGVTLTGFGRKYTNFGDLAGSHMLLGTYGTGDYTSFDTNGWVITPPGGVVPGRESGTWSAIYVGEQRLWQDPCNEKRYTRMQAYAGTSSRVDSPFAFTTSVSVEAFGPMDERPADRMGAAWFYSNLNSPFQNAFSAITPLGNIQGGEVYYNAQITPWFNLTLDVQVIEPAIRANDTTVVLGLRGSVAL